MNHEELFNNIHSNSILLILIECTLLLIVLKSLKKYLPLLPKKITTRKIIKKYFIIAEIIVWFAFFSIILYKINTLNISILIPTVIIVVSLLLYFSWYHLREYFIGIVFKTSYNLSVDDIISINDVTGRIKKIQNNHIELECNNGDIVFYKFSMISRCIVRKKAKNKQGAMFSFQLQIHSYEIINDVIKYILSFPSVSANKIPSFNILSTNDGIITVDISFTSLDEDMNELIMSNVKNKFENILVN